MRQRPVRSSGARRSRLERSTWRRLGDSDDEPGARRCGVALRRLRRRPLLARRPLGATG